MNSLTVLFFCAVVVAAVNGAVWNPVIRQYQQFKNECMSSTNTDPKELAKVFKNGPVEVEVLGAYLDCINKKFNIYNENGDIDQDNLRKILLVFHPSEDKINEVVTNCSVKKEGATPQEIAVELVKCTQKIIQLTPPPNSDAQ